MEPTQSINGEGLLSKEAMEGELKTLLTMTQELMKTDPKFLPLRGVFTRTDPRTMEEYFSDQLLHAQDCAMAGLNILEQGRNGIGPNDEEAICAVIDILTEGKSFLQGAVKNRDLDPSIMGLLQLRSNAKTPGKVIG